MSLPMFANDGGRPGPGGPGQGWPWPGGGYPPYPYPPFPATQPLLLSVTPVSGPTTGGNTVLVVGLGLNNAISVSFGGTPATTLARDPFGLAIAVSAPPHAAATVPVTVTTPNGTSNAVNYTYVAPALPPTATAITPATGPAAGGTPFVIQGTGLAGASVTIGGATATAVTVDSTGTLLLGITPAGTVGNQPVVVTTANGSVTVAGGFTYV